MADKKSNKVTAQPEKETKKPAARTEKKEKEQKSQPNAVTRFVRETVGELRKVNWPTWPEARHLTGVVLLVLFVMSIFLGLIDAGAAYIMQLAMGLR